MRALALTFLRCTICCLGLLWMSCAPLPSAKRQRPLDVRVGLVQHRDSVVVVVPEKSLLRTFSGKRIGGRLSPGRWLVTVARSEATDAEDHLLRLQHLGSQEAAGEPRFEMESGLQIDAEGLALLDVTVGQGFHWQSQESRLYRGALQFLIDRFERLTVVNVLPVEAYIAGVASSEMHADFPLEALKAQAVAARSALWSRLGTRHVADGFDLCADVHCQVYGGITWDNENARHAVAATAGLVLSRGGRAVDAAYHGVCGGHTESNEAVWKGAAQPHLRGVFDGDGRPDMLGETLTQEDHVTRWIDSQPPVYCNLATGSARALDYGRKYFRWEISASRETLQQQIAKSTSENFGDLIDLVPLQRGRSGRLRRLKVVGTLRSFEISSELAIRRSLSASTLWSSCFVIDRETRNGTLEKLTFRGAGWGHGVGMCQVGALTMAGRGMTFVAILQHYYRGTTLANAY